MATSAANELAAVASAMKPLLTEQQRRALNTRDSSVALSAGAGCGKTFVLTERFLALFDPREPQALAADDLHHVMAITFTERAAREMRDRIRHKCYERLLAADQADADYWLRLVRSLDTARVSTIHSFCSSLLRAHAVDAGLDPQFTVLEQAQAETLLAEVIEDKLRELLAKRDESCIDFMVSFGLEPLRVMLAQLVARRNMRAFDDWSKRTAVELVDTWAAYFRDVATPAALERVARSPAANRLLEVLGRTRPSHPLMCERCEKVVAQLSAWRDSPRKSHDPLAELLELRECAKVGRTGHKAWECEEDYTLFRDSATKLRDEIDKVVPLLQFDPEAAQPAAEAGLALLRLANQTAGAYEERKQDLAALDFHDLVSRAAALLTAPEHETLRRELSSSIQLLLVDEFQDTDPLQVQLVKALCGDEESSGKLFFVGDQKQSIYRFRGAAPQVFRKLRAETSEYGRQQLTLNFRSQPAILDFVNALFAEEFPDYEALEPHRTQTTPTPAVEFLWARADEQNESKQQIRRREAEWIARRLRNLLDNREPLIVDEKAGGLRALKVGDVAILFRALSDVAFYEEALRQHRIPYYLVGGHAFYAQQEIYDLTNLLRTLENPLDSISLAGVLRSPFFSIADETLYWLAQHPRGISHAVISGTIPAEVKSDDRRQLVFAIKTLSDLRQNKDILAIPELINEALEKTGYDAILLTEFLGERKLANLQKLVQQARQFSRSGLFTLSDFIAQLSGFIVKQPDEPLAATHPESTEVVRLMTVHQAKGLEFPLVVVPDLARPTKSGGDRAVFSPELGPLVKLPTAYDGTRPPGGYDLYELVESQEDAAELSRLFYVATTRAADYLILSSGLAAQDAKGGPWLQLLASRFDLNDGRFQGDGRRHKPQVRVSCEQPETTASQAIHSPRVNLAELVTKVTDAASQVTGGWPSLVEPFPADPDALREYSFSRLSGRLHARRLRFSAPGADDGAFDTERVDPISLGTLVHAVLADQQCAGGSDVAIIVKRHAERQMDCADAATRAAVRLVQQFLTCPLAADLDQAAESYRELEFVLRWPLGSKSGGILLTGTIDRLYKDASGNWGLVDFKTNKVTKSNVAKIATAYEMQMLVYGLAAQQLLKCQLASNRLHFLRGNLPYEFKLGPESERRLNELLQAGLAAI